MVSTNYHSKLLRATAGRITAQNAGKDDISKFWTVLDNGLSLGVSDNWINLCLRTKKQVLLTETIFFFRIKM